MGQSTVGLRRHAVHLLVVAVAVSSGIQCEGGMATIDPPLFQVESEIMEPIHSILGDLELREPSLKCWEAGCKEAVHTNETQPAPQIPFQPAPLPTWIVPPDGSFQVEVITPGTANWISIGLRRDDGTESVDYYRFQSPSTWAPGTHSLLDIPVGHGPLTHYTVEIRYGLNSTESFPLSLPVIYGQPVVDSGLLLASSPLTTDGQFKKLFGSCGGAATFSASLKLTQSGSSLTLVNLATGETSTGVIGADGHFEVHSPGGAERYLGLIDAHGVGGVLLWKFTPAGCAEVYLASLTGPNTGPAFTLGIVPSEVSTAAGGPATGADITLVRSGGFINGVELTIDPTDPGISASLSVGAIGDAQSGLVSHLTVSAAAGTPPGRYLVAVRGKATGLPDAITVLAVNVASTGGSFSLLVAPSTVTVNAGGTGSSTGVNVQRIPPYGGAVALAVEGLPAGASATVTPNPIPVGYSSASIHLSATAATAAGSYPLTVRASGPGATDQTMPLSLTVQSTAASFALALDSSAIHVIQGASGDALVRVRRANFAGAVTLVATSANSITSSFVPNPVAIPDTTAVGTFTVPAALAPGSYTVTINGTTSGSVADQLVQLTVIVVPPLPPPSFTLSVDSTTLHTFQDSSRSTAVRIQRVNFTGTVTLTATLVPVGMTTDFAPTTLTVAESLATLTVTAGDSLAVGLYNLRITASSPGMPDQDRGLFVDVQYRDRGFSLHLNPDRLILHPGETGSTTITATRYDPGGAITLSDSLSLGLPAFTFVFSPNPIAAGDSTATIQITVPADAPANAAAPRPYTIYGITPDGRWTYAFGDVIITP
jgi:hypothetical protein